MKKKLLISLLVLILLIMLFPVKMHLKDGGSVIYQSPLRLYRVTNWHQMLPLNDGEEMRYKEGLSIEIFGQEIYNNTLNIPTT